jgi:transposase
VNDHLLLAMTLDAVVVERPAPTEDKPQHLCPVSGQRLRQRAGATGGGGMRIPRAPSPDWSGLVRRSRIGEEKKDETGQKKHSARRWVVGRTFSWLSRWRGLLVRWDKKPQNYLANLKLACALLWIRRAYQAGSPLLG